MSMKERGFFGKLHCELIYVKDTEEIVTGGII